MEWKGQWNSTQKDCFLLLFIPSLLSPSFNSSSFLSLLLLFLYFFLSFSNTVSTFQPYHHWYTFDVVREEVASWSTFSFLSLSLFFQLFFSFFSLYPSFIFLSPSAFFHYSFSILPPFSLVTKIQILLLLFYIEKELRKKRVKIHNEKQ